MKIPAPQLSASDALFYTTPLHLLLDQVGSDAAASGSSLQYLSCRFGFAGQWLP